MDFSNFYLVCFISMGCVLATTGIMTKTLMRDPLSTPLWWIKSAAIYNIISMTSLALALVSMFIKYDTKWMFISFGEALLGSIIPAFLGRTAIIYLTFISPAIYLIIIGAIWGFWFITENDFYAICAIIAAGYLYVSRKESNNIFQKFEEQPRSSIDLKTNNYAPESNTAYSIEKSIDSNAINKTAMPIEINSIEIKNKLSPAPNIEAKKSNFGFFEIILALIGAAVFLVIVVEVYNGINSKQHSINSSTTQNTAQTPQKSETKPLRCTLSVGDECEIKIEMRTKDVTLPIGTRIFITSDTDSMITIMVNNHGEYIEFEMKKEILRNYL